MHRDSGLLDEHLARADDGTARLLPTPEEAGKMIARMVRRHTDEPVTLAGSGVGVFDLRWIEQHMPELANMLTYWVIDVGVIRRFLRDVVGMGNVLAYQGPAEKAHRAMADVEDHLTEALYYRRLLGSLKVGI